MSPRTTALPPWSRRTFVTRAALASAALNLRPALALASLSGPLTLKAHPALPGSSTPGLTLHMADSLLATCTTPHRPAALALHPKLPVAYAALSGPDPALLAAFRLQQDAPHIEPLSTQAVALSASQPRALAVTSDGLSLLTLDHFGLLTVHPLLHDGSIAPVRHLRRLTGSPDHPGSLPRPTHLTLHPDGHTAFILDPGCHRRIPVDLTSPEGPTLLPERPLAWNPPAPPATDALTVTLQL